MFSEIKNRNTVHQNVCDIIVANELCVGCGVCAGICPGHVLEMRWNQQGEYIPIEVGGECSSSCSLCLSICPFAPDQENETSLATELFSSVVGIRYLEETGYILNSYVGYAVTENFRENGASGGLATWFLTRLLRERVVDRVICVKPQQDTEKLFAFSMLNTAEDVKSASRSCYYPVEMSGVIKQIIAEDGRYAVVVLPCFAKALRLAMKRLPILRKRIKVIVGLVCGQMKSKAFVEYLQVRCAGSLLPLDKVTFRIKEPARPASDYGIRLEWQEQGRCCSKTFFWTEGMGKIFTYDYFKLNSCNYCDDLFAETADVVFMDAWLPEYKSDYRGHNIVINRQERFKQIWETALAASEVTLRRIDIDAAIRSQRSGLSEKRDGLQFRLFIAENTAPMPRKRVAPAIAGNLIQRQLWRLKLRASHITRSSWSEQKNLSRLQQAIKGIERQICLWEIMRRCHSVLSEGRIWSTLQTRLKRLLPRRNS